jgi:hypothetical protein
MTVHENQATRPAPRARGAAIMTRSIKGFKVDWVTGGAGGLSRGLVARLS